MNLSLVAFLGENSGSYRYKNGVWFVRRSDGRYHSSPRWSFYENDSLFVLEGNAFEGRLTLTPKGKSLLPHIQEDFTLTDTGKVLLRLL